MKNTTKTDGVHNLKSNNGIKSRIIWLDILKIIACFCVIVNHAGGCLLKYTGRYNSPVLFYSICFAICKIGVPIFLMITGCLLLKKEFSYKDVVKSIFRILLPLVILSLLIYIKKYGFNINFIVEFLKNPIILPYWYLYMLIGLYLVIPFIQKMVRNFNMNDYRNLLIICLLIPGTFPLLQNIFKISISSYFQISLLPASISYLLAGVYLSKVPLNKINRNIALVMFIIPIMIFILSIYIPFLNTKEISYVFDSWTYITTSFPALSLFYLVRYYFENMKNVKIIQEISLLTFGIYLFHNLIIYKTYNMSIVQIIFSFSAYIGVIFLEVLCFAICGIFTYILRKISIIRKFL